MEFPSSTLTAAQEGAHFDMRFRIAMQLATSLGFAAMAAEQMGPGAAAPAGLFARIALDTAEEIVAQGKARGWIEPLEGLGDELPVHEIAHIQRNARAQVISQTHGHDVMNELAPAVQPVRGGFGRPQ